MEQVSVSISWVTMGYWEDSESAKYLLSYNKLTLRCLYFLLYQKKGSTRAEETRTAGKAMDSISVAVAHF